MPLSASVVIPAYDAGSVIQRCLDALNRQTLDRSEFEIVVVDDGSTDNTAEVVLANDSIRLLRQRNQGPAAARNRGASEARGEIVLFLDADCEPESMWLEEMLTPLENHDEIIAVKGVYKTKQTALISRFAQVEFEYKYAKLSKHKYIDFVDSYSAAFRRDVFLKRGGFDTSFPTACAEDADFSFKLAKCGYKMIFNPDAVVYHLHPSTLGNYLRRKYMYISWRPVVTKRYPARSLHDSYAPLTFKMQIILAPISLCTFFLFLVDKGMQVPFVVSIVGFIASTLPFTWQAVTKDWQVAIFSLPILFVRGIAQFLGLAVGFARLFFRRDTIL